MDHVIELEEAESFHRCRRAWDFGAAARRNLEPVQPLRPFDLPRAIRDGLAAWYFPAMWAWTRSLVRPIAAEAFHKSMRAERAAFLATQPHTHTQTASEYYRQADDARANCRAP